MLFKLAWRNLWRNKRRTIITISSVLFAVIFAIAIKGLKEGMYDRMIDNMVGNYFGYIQVHADGYWKDQVLENSLTLNPELLDSLKQKKFVKESIPRLQNFALVSSDTLTKGAMIMGVDVVKEKKVSKMGDRIIEGSMIHNDKDEVLLGYKLAKFLKVGIEDTVVVMGQGFRGSLAAGKYVVKGLLKFPNPELNSNLMLMSISTCQYLMNADSRATALILEISNPNHINRYTAELDNYLSDNYEVMGWKEMLPELNKMIEGDRAEGVILMSVLYILVSFGIFGTVLMMLSERRYEFGVMVAIGLKKSKLAFLVWIEMVFITVIGGIGGMILAYPILLYFNYNPIYLGDDVAEAFEDFGFEPVMQSSTDPAILLQQGIIVILLASLISIYPVIRIFHLNSVKAMRV